MSHLEQLSYCGLYCGLCAQNSRIPELSKRLRDTMGKEGYPHWGQRIPGFKELWSYLERLCSSGEKTCCRMDSCGVPSCGIRKCAQEKKLEVCILCNEDPCSRILSLAKGYPTLLADGERMKEIGIEKWVKEQEDRRQTGFACVDIRCYPYDV